VNGTLVARLARMTLYIPGAVGSSLGVEGEALPRYQRCGWQAVVDGAAALRLPIASHRGAR
jgi:hypothetical protein